MDKTLAATDFCPCQFDPLANRSAFLPLVPGPQRYFVLFDRLALWLRDQWSGASLQAVSPHLCIDFASDRMLYQNC